MQLKIFLVSVILYPIFMSNFFAQTAIADFSQDIIVRNNQGDTTIVSFGLDPIATDGIDQELGEDDLPPLPPIDVWDIRLKLPPNDWNELSSLLDYRNETNFPYTGQREHRLQYQIGEDTDTLFIEWNFPPEVTGNLQDLIIGTLVNVPMQGSSSFTMVRGVMPDPLLLTQLKMTINYNNVIADVNESTYEIPSDFILEQNYPNPFNPSTTINFLLPFSSEISLKVFNLLGKKVAEIANGLYSAGNHSVVFDAKNLATGIYIYQLKHQAGMISKKMTLIK